MGNKSKIATEVKDLYKSFVLPHEKSTSLKSLFVRGFRKSKTFEKQEVLKGLTFDIKEGEFFGIVGRNGSGKSTLLKLLAGIYSPDKGSVVVNGRLTPFIELGVGFNPDLTGRENVYLNGALLGFSRKEMAEMYDEIVEFAEIERFMDQKLKNYSSGMQVRLAFSIAIRAKSDILLLDEVLAVGDEAFQRKCIEVFEKYKANKQTIILVTHDMSVVEKYCDKAILLHNGDIIESGNPRKVARKYSAMNTENYLSAREGKQAQEAKMQSWGFKAKFTDEKGSQKKSFSYGSQLKVDLKWEEERIKNVGVALLRQSGEYVFGTNTIVDKHKIKDKKVTYSLDLNIEPGLYKVIVGLFGDTEENAVEFIDDDANSILILPIEDRTWGGLTKLNHKWK